MKETNGGQHGERQVLKCVLEGGPSYALVMGYMAFWTQCI